MFLQGAGVEPLASAGLTIEHLKEELEYLWGDPINAQRIDSYEHGPLNNNKLTIAECGLHDGAVLDLRSQLLGNGTYAPDQSRTQK